MLNYIIEQVIINEHTNFEQQCRLYIINFPDCTIQNLALHDVHPSFGKMDDIENVIDMAWWKKLSVTEDGEETWMPTGTVLDSAVRKNNSLFKYKKSWEKVIQTRILRFDFFYPNYGIYFSVVITFY